MSAQTKTEGAFRIVEWIARLDRVDLVLRLTLLDLLLRPVGGAGVRSALLVLAAAAFVLPRLLRSPPLWWAIAFLVTTRVLLDWPLADNHAYLLCYWCVAVGLALSSDDADGFLAHNGRWLIGLVFAFATLWKAVLSPDFLSGVAFRVTLIVDPRFEGLTLLVGGVSPEWLEAARAQLAQHIDGGPWAGGALNEPKRFLALAWFATAWTVVWEALVAVCFLWRQGHGPSRLRDASLIVFCATTYAVAPVSGFAWLLLAMAVAQCDPTRARTRSAYLAVYVVVLFYRELPWLALMTH